MRSITSRAASGCINRRRREASARSTSKRPNAPPLPGGDGPAGNALALILGLALRGASPDELYGALAGERLITDADTALEVVRRLPATLAAQHRSMQDAEAWRFRLVQLLCDGQYGPKVADEFPEKYLAAIVDRLEYTVRQLEEFDEVAEWDWPNDPVPRRALEDVRRSLGKLANTKRRGDGLRRAFIRSRNRPDETRQELPSDGVMAWKENRSDPSNPRA